MRARVVVPLVGVMLLAAGWLLRERMWTPSYEELAERREALASVRTEAELHVALVRTSRRSTVQAFVDGAKMAEDEINKSGGITLFDGQQPFKRPLSIRVYDAPAPEASTSKRVKATTVLARRIAADPNVVAVIGHSFDASIAASVIYNAAGVIYFATRNTDPALTIHRDMPYVFRVCPTDNDIMDEMVDLIPNMVKEKKVGKKTVSVLYLYPRSAARAANDNPATRLKTIADKLLTDAGKSLVDFKADGLPYNPDALEEIFQNDETERLIADTDRFNVLMIADLSVAATTLRERIGELWTGQSLGDRRKEKLIQPKIFDLGDLVGFEDQPADSSSLTTDVGDSACERMVRLILTETKQNAVVLFERESIESSKAVAGESSSSGSISSRSGYGKQLIAHLSEDVPLTEDCVDALCQLSVLNVVLARTYDPTTADFSEIVAEVKSVPGDYVYLVGSNRSALMLLKQLRRAGVTTPVIGSPRLEEQLRRTKEPPPVIGVPGEVDDETPEALGLTYLATTFDAWSDEPHVTGFLSKYQAYLERVRRVKIKNIRNEFPGTAAYGYVSIQLLKSAFEGAKTASPRMAAQYARLFVLVDGPLGNRIGFKGGRDLLNLPIGFQQLGFHDKEHFIRRTRTRSQVQSPPIRTNPSMSRP